MSKGKSLLVPGCSKALNAMKYELAAEIGLLGQQSASADYSSEFADELGSGAASRSSASLDWGSVTSRQNGYIGGSITKRLVEQAQKSGMQL